MIGEVIVRSNDLQVEFATQEREDCDKLECSIYINPNEGTLAIKVGDVEITGVLLRSEETLAGFYFPQNRIKILDEPEEESQAIWVLN